MSRSMLAASMLCAMSALCPLRVAQAAPPVLSDVEVPSQVVTGVPITFRVGYKDADGDLPTRMECTIDGPGGTQSKRYMAPAGADGRTGFVASFPMGPFALDGEYTVRFTADSGDGVAQSPTQKIVVINLTRRYIELAVGIAVCLLIVPLLVFLFMRIIAARRDPRSAARFGLVLGVALAYVWYVYLFGAMHQAVGIGIGAIVTLAAIVALLSGAKSAPATR